MRVRRKNILRVVIVFLVLLEITSVFLMWKSANNKDITLNDVKLKSVNKNSGLAIMIEQEDGTYKESSSNTWPEDMMFNEEKSGCIDNEGNAIDGALTYDSGIANIKTKSSSFCYLYFDIKKDDVTIAISTDGVEGAMPSSGAYTNSATCSSGSITWSDKYQRIEIGDIGKTPSKCNIAFTKDTSSKTLLRTEVESKATTNSNGYRYSGKAPNNWVWFNGEKWRIIGSIPTCTSSGCATSENLVKIIRSESIGTYAYDASSTTTKELNGIWGSNTLYNLLNTHYYSTTKSGLNGQNHVGCYSYYNSSYQTIPNCDYTERGILSSSYYGKMVKNVYWNTGASETNVTPSAAYTNETATQTVSGYVGVMSISDWGYANSSYHNKLMNASPSASITNQITSTSWIFNNAYEWTSIQYSHYTYQTIRVDYDGYLDSSLPYIGYAVRPVVYLDSGVYIVSGEGTEANPYIIGM